MKKIIRSLFNNTVYYLLHFIIPSALVGIAVCLLIIIINYLKLQKKPPFKAFFMSKLKTADCSYSFLSAAYISCIFQSTIFHRFITNQLNQDPLCNIYGGWGISEEMYFYDFSPMWNVIMFLPACALIYFFIKSALKKAVSDKGLMIVSTCFGFGFSLIIENLQILTKTGTFQFSDLFYNTLGALLGAIIFIFIKKRISNKKHLKA